MTDPENTMRKLRDYHDVECYIITDALACSVWSIIEDRSFSFHLGIEIIMNKEYQNA